MTKSLLPSVSWSNRYMRRVTPQVKMPQFTFKLSILLLVMVALIYAVPAHAETAGQYIVDASITAKVKSALFADSHQVANSKFQVLRMTVVTQHGDVILSGPVDTPAQEFAAIQIATLINGVVQVTDNLTVKSLQSD